MKEVCISGGSLIQDILGCPRISQDEKCRPGISWDISGYPGISQDTHSHPGFQVVRILDDSLNLKAFLPQHRAKVDLILLKT
jgi:hypothetical protein